VTLENRKGEPMTDETTWEDSRPLAGVRVLDLSRLVAGNMVSHLLADFGADVIKVERPDSGDDLRNWQEDGVEIFWKVYARNKRSICWDLKCETDRSKLLQLVETAQVFIESFVPGKLEEMGLGPDLLFDRNPNLIVVRVSGWGQSGPYRERPGFGTLIEAMSGYAHLNGFPDRPPALPPLATADMIAGLYGAYGVMMALRHVEVQGGQGQVIDLSLFESMFSFVASEAVKYRVSGQVSLRSGNQAMHTAPRNIYPCRDGKFIALSASMQGMCERLLTAIGRPDLIQDPRFRTNEARVQNRNALDQIIQDFLVQRDLAENLRFFEEAQVTVGPVLAMDDLLHHPYMAGRGVVTEFPDPHVGSIPAHAPVPRLSRTPGMLERPAPALDADREAIEADLEESER
jgi:crotonobetainyl-CoA:carnitine CoA-transferase CaiB-like acyl-CoA transferase